MSPTNVPERGHHEAMSLLLGMGEDTTRRRVSSPGLMKRHNEAKSLLSWVEGEEKHNGEQTPPSGMQERHNGEQTPLSCSCFPVRQRR